MKRLIAALCALAVSVALPQTYRLHAAVAPNAPQGFLFTVTTLDDHNDFRCDGSDCTLREAIQAANNAATDDTIDFAVTGTIDLESALPGISDSVTIEGPGAQMLTVRAHTGGPYRIFDVTTTGTVTISGLTITGGLGTGGGIRNFSTGTVNVNNCIIRGNGFNFSSGGLGAAISNGTGGTLKVNNSTVSDNTGIAGSGILNSGGILHITNTTIRDNFVQGEAAVTGGVANFQGTVSVTNSTIRDNVGLSEAGGIGNNGSLTIINSTISGNRGGVGAGINNENPGELNITNSTISGNHARLGGAIFNSGTANFINSTTSGNRANIGGGIYNNFGILNVTNSTITNNEAPGPTGNGGGIYNFDPNNGVDAPGPFSVKSTIIGLNTAVAGPDAHGPFNSAGFNLVGKTDNSTGFTAPTDLTGTIAGPLDPKLDLNGLQDNGGPTLTIALLSNSPAIDKGTANSLVGALTTDQRGMAFPRTVDDPAVPPATGGDNTDIGAFEFSPPPLTAGNALLINESCPPANGAMDPGERVTVNLELINISSAATSNLVATLQSSSGVLAPSAPQSYGAIDANGSAARDFSFTANGSLSSGQTITATLQLQDGTNNLGTVSFNFTAGPAPCSFVRLVVSSSLSRADASTVVGAITVQNIGSLAADAVMLTTAKLGATNGTPLPQGLGNLAPGESASVMVNFNNSTPGTSSMLTAGGTYTGATFSSTKRVTIP
jgi:CSLREA domain-containing protein